MSRYVDGHKVVTGDIVCFKSDVEQCGKVVRVVNIHGNTSFDLEATNKETGFYGDYIGGSEHTTVSAAECWIE